MICPGEKVNLNIPNEFIDVKRMYQLLTVNENDFAV